MGILQFIPVSNRHEKTVPEWHYRTIAKLLHLEHLLFSARTVQNFLPDFYGKHCWKAPLMKPEEPVHLQSKVTALTQHTKTENMQILRFEESNQRIFAFSYNNLKKCNHLKLDELISTLVIIDKYSWHVPFLTCWSIRGILDFWDTKALKSQCYTFTGVLMGCLLWALSESALQHLPVYFIRKWTIHAICCLPSEDLKRTLNNSSKQHTLQHMRKRAGKRCVYIKACLNRLTVCSLPTLKMRNIT